MARALAPRPAVVPAPVAAGVLLLAFVGAVDLAVGLGTAARQAVIDVRADLAATRAWKRPEAA